MSLLSWVTKVDGVGDDHLINSSSRHEAVVWSFPGGRVADAWSVHARMHGQYLQYIRWNQRQPGYSTTCFFPP